MFLTALSSVALTALVWCTPFSAAAQPIRAVTEATPYSRLQDGKVVGSGVDLVEAVLNRARLTEHRFELYPWARAYDIALKAPNVLLFMIGRTPEREHLFKWVGEVIEVKYQMYKLRQRTDIQPTLPSQLANYSIGLKRGDVLQLQYPAASYPKLVISATNLDTFRKLVGGQIDMMPLPRADLIALCQTAHVDCHNLQTLPAFGTTQSAGLAFSQQTPDDIVQRAREALTALRAESKLPALVPAEATTTD